MTTPDYTGTKYPHGFGPCEIVEYGDHCPPLSVTQQEATHDGNG